MLSGVDTPTAREALIEQRHRNLDADYSLGSPEAVDFERQRLTLFNRNGFPAESRWVEDRAGRHTYVIARGRGPRPTILVHGAFSQASEWALLAPHLGEHVLIPDWPGHGLSYAVDHRRIDFKRAAADWLLDLVDAVGADEIDLIGNSIGGAFALLFAARYPTRVGRLALIGAPAGLDPAGVPLLLRMMGVPGVGRLLTRSTPKDIEALRRMLGRLILTAPDRVPPDFLEVMLAAGNLPGRSESAHSLFSTVTTLRGWRRSLLINDEVVGVQAPTLFVWGEDDVFSPPSIGDMTVATMPKARIVKLANAGHVPYIDHPEAVAAALDEFLS